MVRGSIQAPRQIADELRTFCEDTTAESWGGYVKYMASLDEEKWAVGFNAPHCACFVIANRDPNAAEVGNYLDSGYFQHAFS